mmetsp:Transcript_10374/g.29172  ORF Transcript_10374/g.29172 Transcript_10374/m.29172 type:complete len:168 (-) Transcript_10374:2226-2729(-)
MLGSLEADLLRNFPDGRAAERLQLLKSARQGPKAHLHQDRSAFLAFMVGTLSPPEYSPVALRQLLERRLVSDTAAQHVLDSMHLNEHPQLWNEMHERRNEMHEKRDVIHEKRGRCQLILFSGKSGLLAHIASYAGVLTGREARIVRQLTEILPEMNKELDRMDRDDE